MKKCDQHFIDSIHHLEHDPNHLGVRKQKKENKRGEFKERQEEIEASKLKSIKALWHSFPSQLQQVLF